MPVLDMSLAKLKEYKGTIYPDFGHEGLPGQSDRVFEFMGGL